MGHQFTVKDRIVKESYIFKDENDNEKYPKELAAYGGLDVVYNNAAIQRFGPMPDFSIEDWRVTIQVARDAITKKTLLKRFGLSEELVELAAFIASDRATYITAPTSRTTVVRLLGNSYSLRHNANENQ
ncbi:hypothetical protein PAECIP111891_00606 [Paenibacillus allorhizoplanae]|uniref:SDR family oxidoreductase n=1 Tax=Paenibacillus allorhizoplanae TaxID=2905648 RepID=A0ABM9BUL1_9BACL|nr:hypothetical protein [Paenibacillus allorhizoplanae]CAH1195138.1 hypothetical protein PAECIP111891_00606 [Paenibacillus allorhizoplanae]